MSIITDYESLTNLKSLKGRAVKIKNPKNCGIGGAWVEGLGDVKTSGFDIPVRGSVLIKNGFEEEIDPDFLCENFSFDYPTKHVVLDKASSEAIRALSRDTHERRVAAARASKPQESKPQLRIYLSSRGWGDYAPLAWTGSIDTPNETILEECKSLFDTEYDVDMSYNENRVKAAIDQAKAEYHKKAAERSEAKKRAKAVIATTPDEVARLAAACKFDPENLEDDIDHPLYWAVRNYVEALSV